MGLYKIVFARYYEGVVTASAVHSTEETQETIMSNNAATLKKPVQVVPHVNEEATTTNPDEVVHNVPTVSKLAEAVKDAKYRQSETLNELRTARDYHTNAIDEIDQMLSDLGHPVDANGSTNGNGASLSLVPTKPTTRGSGPRQGNKATIADSVEGLLLKYENGLSRTDITVKMHTEVEYKTKSDDPKDFAATVYTGGINKLMTDGKVITIGKRPHTIYKHITKATPQEVADFKKE